MLYTMLDLSTLTYFTVKYYGTLGTYRCFFFTYCCTQRKYRDLVLRELLVSYF